MRQPAVLVVSPFLLQLIPELMVLIAPFCSEDIGTQARPAHLLRVILSLRMLSFAFFGDLFFSLLYPLLRKEGSQRLSPGV